VLARLLALPRLVRWLLSLTCLVAASGLAWLSAGPPQLTLLNTSLVVDFPWARGLSALGCAAVLALAALVAPHARARLAGFVAVLLPLAVGLHLLLYRVEAGDDGLRTRGLLGQRTLAWREVQSLRLAAETVTVEGGGSEIRIDTVDFSPDQRAALARSLARRVNESGAGQVLTVPQ
jgi:hypothetical protein